LKEAGVCKYFCRTVLERRWTATETLFAQSPMLLQAIGHYGSAKKNLDIVVEDETA
jgi:hypothetical protein